MPFLKRAVILSLLLVCQLIAVILLAALILDSRQSGTILHGITVQEMQLGGLCPVDATHKLEQAFPVIDKRELVLLGHNNQYYRICLAGIGAAYDYQATTDKAMTFGKSGNLPASLITVLKLRASTVDLNMVIRYDEDRLAEEIEKLCLKTDAPPQNAEVKLVDMNVIIENEQPGRSLDIDATLKQVHLSLLEGSFQARAVIRYEKPDITSTDLASIDSLLAEYTTSFDRIAVNRSHNIAIASDAVNNTLVKPGEIFSLNQKLGPRRADRGYLKAPVFIDNRLALDFGGGICQVASTLYNAVILSDLIVVERHPHPLPVNYVESGRDAAISGDYMDLKFANNYIHPIYITCLVEGGDLKVRIFGNHEAKNPGKRIISEKTIIYPRVVTINDDTLPPGETRIVQPGHPGYHVRVYREMLINNLIESRTLLTDDYYRPADRIIRTGPVTVNNEK